MHGKFTLSVVSLLCLIGCSEAVSTVDGSHPLGNGPAVLQQGALIAAGPPMTESDFTVLVLDADGFAAVNSAVVFSVVAPESGVTSALRIRTPGNATLQTSISTTTDEHGLAKVTVAFGRTVGNARVRAVSVPSQTFTHASFTTYTGPLDHVTLVPATNISIIGQPVQLVAATLDAQNNFRSDTVRYTSTSGASVTSAAVATGLTSGIHQVTATATADGVTRSAVVELWVTPTQQLSFIIGNGTLTMGTLSGAGPRVTIAPPTVAASAWRPGTDQIAYITEPSLKLFVRDITTGSVTEIAPGLRELNWPEFSPDGQWLYFSGYNVDGVTGPLVPHIYRAHADGSGLAIVTPADTGSAVTVSPDGNMIAFASYKSLRTMDLRTGEVRVIAAGGATGTDSPRWSPDGKYIAYLQGFLTGAVAILDVASGTTMNFVTSSNRGFAWSSDSQWLVTERLLIHVPTKRQTALSTTGWFPAWRR